MIPLSLIYCITGSLSFGDGLIIQIAYGNAVDLGIASLSGNMAEDSINGT